MTPAIGLYFFAIAFVLAQLEIQIEGAHGWAEKLPTWRWQTPAVLRWAGKPITGYHVFLLLFILLFMHLPMMYVGFWFQREAASSHARFISMSRSVRRLAHGWSGNIWSAL